MTCCGAATFMALTTTLPFGTLPVAIAMARSAATASVAVPLTTTWPSLAETRMPRVPVLDWMFCCRLPVSSATSTSRMPICFNEPSNRMTLVVPVCLPWM